MSDRRHTRTPWRIAIARSLACIDCGALVDVYLAGGGYHRYDAGTARRHVCHGR